MDTVKDFLEWLDTQPQEHVSTWTLEQGFRMYVTRNGPVRARVVHTDNAKDGPDFAYMLTREMAASNVRVSTRDDAIKLGVLTA